MSKKSSSQANQSTTSTPITLQDVEGVSISAGNSPTLKGGSSINVTDGGAIKGSFDLAGRGFDLAGLTVEAAADLTLGLVGQQAQAGRAALEFAQAQANAGYEFAMNAGRSDVATMQDTTKKVMIVVGMVAAAFVLSRWGK